MLYDPEASQPEAGTHTNRRLNARLILCTVLMGLGTEAIATAPSVTIGFERPFLRPREALRDFWDLGAMQLQNYQPH